MREFQNRTMYNNRRRIINDKYSAVAKLIAKCFRSTAIFDECLAFSSSVFKRGINTYNISLDMTPKYTLLVYNPCEFAQASSQK